MDKNERILCSSILLKDIELINEEVTKSKGALPNNIDRGLVFSGFRHPNCIVQIFALTGKRLSEFDYIQGFLTDQNRFVDRVEGRQIAINSGQVKEEEIGKLLFSEDLW